ncbi:MAG TPA: hypothetical protein VKB68_20535 [Stellaceae bacterium]|nr:hypothetical protein [Stellaceae bacterium]
MPGHRRALIALAGAWLLLVLGAPVARAQVADCDQISHLPGDKIVMDSVKGVSGTVSGPMQIRLQNALDMKLGELNQDLKSLVKFVFCDARWPGSESVFDADRSELLNDYGVMVEAWGELSGDDAVLYFAIIPVRHYEYFKASATSLTGYEVAEYRAAHGAADPDVRLTLFGGAGELKAMVSLALGVAYARRAPGEADRMKKTNLYDSSRAFFCNALTLLDQVRPKTPGVGFSASDWQVLVDYAGKSAQAIAQNARADAGYAGLMKQLPEEKLRDCPKPP